MLIKNIILEIKKIILQQKTAIKPSETVRYSVEEEIMDKIVRFNYKGDIVYMWNNVIRK